MSSTDDLSVLRDGSLAEAVDRFEELSSQSGRAFLIGAGCSKCAGLPLMDELTEKVLVDADLDDTSKSLLTSVRDEFEGVADANIEDYLSELVDRLSIIKRREDKGVKNATAAVGTISYTCDQIDDALVSLKQSVARHVEKPASLDIHRTFVRAAHRPVRPGTFRPSHSIDYFVLNYDTLLEDALALERVPFADGIEGGSTGWWNPQSFSRDALEARVYKLHGSIDWRELRGDPLPRRIGKRIDRTRDEKPVVIWPASTKYRETQVDPFAQLARRMREILRPAANSQCVLVVCGYGFRDSHINAELAAALREAPGELTLAVFTSDESPGPVLEQWRSEPAISDRILVYAKRGFFHGDQVITSREALPWWKFETIARLLGGER